MRRASERSSVRYPPRDKRSPPKRGQQPDGRSSVRVLLCRTLRARAGRKRPYDRRAYFARAIAALPNSTTSVTFWTGVILKSWVMAIELR
jgi:hypothetical protein